MSKLFGRATVRANGVELLVDDDAAMNFGGVERETILGTKVQGFVEKAVAPFVEIKSPVTRDDSPEEWGKVENATIVFELDSGQAYVLSEAWEENAIQIAGGQSGKPTRKFVSKTPPKRIR